MPDDRQRAEDDLAYIRAMMEEGRKSAGVDGGFMQLWGPLLALGFLIQFLSVAGLLPALLGAIWIPVFVIGWAGSFWLGRRRACASQGRSGRFAYGAAWMGTGLAVLVHFIPALLAGTFDPLAVTLLSTALFAVSFFVMAQVTGLRWVYGVAAGWAGLLAWFTVRDAVVPGDLLVLAAACILLIYLPGLALSRIGAARRHGAGPASSQAAG